MTIETQKLKSSSIHYKLLNKLKVAKKPEVAEKLPSNLWIGLLLIIQNRAEQQQ